MVCGDIVSEWDKNWTKNWKKKSQFWSIFSSNLMLYTQQHKSFSSNGHFFIIYNQVSHIFMQDDDNFCYLKNKNHALYLYIKVAKGAC